MSTHIKGYKAEQNIVDLHSLFIKEIKPKAKEVAKLLYAKKIAKEFCKQFDDISLGRIKPTIGMTAKDLLSDIYMEDITGKNQKDAYDRTNIYFSVFFFPDETTTLLVPQWSNIEFIDIIDQYGNLIEYGWQNQTDKPDWITTRKWKQREREWKKQIGRLGSLAERGLKLQIIEDHEIDPEPETIWENVTSLEGRIHAQAKNIYLTEKYNPNKGAGQVIGLAQDFDANGDEQKKYKDRIRPYMVEIEKDTEVILRIDLSK